MRKNNISQLLTPVLCLLILLPQQLFAEVVRSFQTPNSAIIKVVEDSGMRFESLSKQNGKTILTMFTQDNNPVKVSIEFTPPTQPNTSPKADIAIEYEGHKVYQEVTQTLSQLAELFKNAGSIPESEINKRANDIYEPFIQAFMKAAAKLPRYTLKLGQKALARGTSFALGSVTKVGALMLIGTIVFSAVIIHGQWDDGMITGLRALEMVGGDLIGLIKPAGAYGAFIIVRNAYIRGWFGKIPGVGDLIARLSQAVRNARATSDSQKPLPTGGALICEDLFSPSAQPVNGSGVSQ
jgi:uncharacterized membrane protein YphA (DoxX/SURF4 family)